MCRMVSLAFAIVLAAISPAGAVVQPFYFHYSTGGAAIPAGGDPHYYMDSAPPMAGTPIVTAPIGISRDATGNLPTFTSTAVGLTTLERRVVVTVNLSANGAMNSCAVIFGTLERVTSSGVATIIGTASESTTSIPQGSGGGLVGYASIPIYFEMNVDRTIASTDSLRVKVSVRNSCASNRSIRLVFDGSVTSPNEPSRAEFDTPDITVFGAPQTFGTYGPLVSSTAKLAKSSVGEWHLDLGETFFFSTVAPSDGTVFVGNFFLTVNPFYPTSCSTVVTCFNPESKNCADDAGAGTYFFSSIRIPDTNGDLFSPASASPTSCPVPPLQAQPFPFPAADATIGADIADVEIVQDAQERVQFTSSRGTGFYSSSPPSANDMAIGTITKSSGTWKRSSVVFPATANPNCPNGNCQFLNELESLPGSGHIVYTQYFVSGGDGVIFVADKSGALKASSNVASSLYDVNAPTCNLGTGATAINLTAKSIHVDPTSAASCGPTGCTDERFAVEYDTYTTGGGARSFAFQEFRYDSASNPPTLTPVTPALFVSSPPSVTPQIPSVPCGIKGANPPNQALGVYYDHQGNLWLDRATTVVDVFMRDPVTGKRRLETDTACRWLDHQNQWGVTCPADLEFAVNEGSAGWADDPSTGNVLFVARKGRLFRFSPATTGSGQPTFVKRSTLIDLAIDSFLPTEVLGADEYVSRPTFDPVRRIAWVPTTVAASGIQVNVPRRHWIYAISLPDVMAYP